MLVSIRSHLLLLVLAILVPALLGVSWLVSDTIRSEQQANERTLRDSARALSMMVDHELSQRAAVARMLAQSRWLDGTGDLAPDALDGFRRMARQGLRGLAGWVELQAADGVVLDTREPDGSPRPAAAASLPPLAEQSVVGALRGADAQAAYVVVVEPVTRDGRLIFNVIVSLPASQLQHLIDTQALRGDAVGTVLDSQGTVVARHPGGLAAAGGKASADLMTLLASRREGLFETTSDAGRRSVAYFSTSPQGWTYVSGIERSRYDGLFSQTVQRVVIGAGVLLAFAGVGAIFVSRRVLRPVVALKDAARRMQAGEPVRHSTTGIAECDEVGHALADASEAIQDSRADLERQVAEAVAHTRLAEQRVSQSQRVGALGRLTGGVAHDFNNLLGIISNSVHLIQRHPAAADLQGPIASTLRAVESGSQLTQHLLRFAGRRPVRPQTVALARYLPEAQELMRSMLGRRIEIGVRVAPDTAPIRVDPGELELALINLGLNARDAMPNGGELRLQARNADAADIEGLPTLAAPQRWVMLTVSDDGIGIEPDVLERVFEPFFTTKGPGKGPGLGLSQVHGFCTQAGGAARMDSTPGLGTAVTLLLPSAAGPKEPQPEDGQPANAAPTVAGLRALVVEDNEELGAATAALLRSHGAQVVLVTHAAAALQQLQPQAKFDVVLSDMVMPGDMDGYALAQWIALHHPALPVVLISGYHTVPATPGFRVLTKPCPQDELLAALRDAASGAAQGTASAAASEAAREARDGAATGAWHP
ncbi:ATP-binding protein [Roseateles sp.]|uniref:ATP-binding protein n=1 Tax=Roseateles sp. TaxID=1971397 RepID=UPI003BAD1E3E